MNSRILCILFLTVFSVSNVFAQKGHKIKVKVSGIKDTICYLAGYYGPKQYYKDTAAVDGSGWMVFDGSDSLPGGIYSVILPSKSYFEFIVNEQNFTLETDTLNMIENMKVKGSVENTLFFDHFRMVARLQKESQDLQTQKGSSKDAGEKEKIDKRLHEINKEVVDFKLNIIEKNPNTLLAKIFRSMQDIEIPDPPKDDKGNVIDSLFGYNYMKLHYLDNIDFSDDRLLRTPIFHNKVFHYITKLIPQIPDSINKYGEIVINKSKANKEVFRYTLGKIIYHYETSKIMGMDAVFVNMGEKYYLTGDAYWADSAQLFKINERVRILKPILIGKQAPPIYHVKDKNGNLMPLYSIDKDYLILIFWDPDCGHCKKEMPKLQEVYNKFKGKGVEVFAVCTEVERDKWLKYIDEKKFGWIDVADFDFKSPFRELYDITSTPKVFLLDKQKKIIAKQIGHAELDDILSYELKMERTIRPKEEEAGFKYDEDDVHQ